MSHGRPGDHPITGVLFHEAAYFTPEFRELFKEVYALSHKHFKVFNDIDLSDSNEVIREKLLVLKKELIEDD